MENRGYEIDNSRYPKDFKSIQSSIPHLNLSEIEDHIYEDIVIRMKNQPLPTHQSIFTNHLNMNTPWLSNDHEKRFQRNLTLPLRRDRSGLTQNDAIRYSVRIPSNDGNSQFSCENLQTSETSVADTLSDKPMKRRRKRDCKHCKMKANEEVKIIDNNNTYDDSRIMLEPIFTLPDGRLPNFSNPIDVHNNNNGYCDNPCTVFSISNNINDTCINGTCTNYDKKTIEYDKNDIDPRLGLIEEDRALLTPQKHRNGMKINSIYLPDQWRGKEAPVFIGDFNEPFQRAYSLPNQPQSPSSQNRVNLRRSVRGEPPPQPARLRKNCHGWTLHFTRSLDATNCTRSIILLLIVILTLLGIGSMALYIVFEPEKLQIIQQYLRSSPRNSSTLNFNFTTHNSYSVDDMNILERLTTLQNVKISLPSTTPLPTTPITTTSVKETTITPLLPTTTIPLLEEQTTIIITERQEPVVLLPPSEILPLNISRHCDDCYKGEVCVALVGEEVPTCRTGPDPRDPTGCSGLCLINRQKCHRLDTDAFRCVEVEHYCLDDEWTCSNSLCIPSVKRCDGHMNCYDHSDEFNCACDLRTHFQCGNETSCLPLEKRCDGKIDCWDATDEINCRKTCPSANEFTCNSGQCIPNNRFCDGFVDCEDGSDEPGSDGACLGRCNKHEFTCGNGRCIMRNLKCNGNDDCGDMTDEGNCRDNRIPRKRKR